MSQPSPDPESTPAPGPPNAAPLIDPTIARRVLVGGLALGAVALVAFSLLNRSKAPTPAELAGDPLLRQGYEVYGSRCVSCHGETGRGDGPIARGLTGGPPPGDLTAGRWKHGDRPDQVIDVIANGVPGTNMSGFGKYRILDEAEIRSVAAYVYRLGGKPVPEEYRKAP